MEQRCLEFCVKTSEEAADAVSWMLLDEGAQGVATEDPQDILSILDDPDCLIFTDPGFREELPDYVRIRAYFTQLETEEEARRLPANLERRFREIGDYLDLGPASCTWTWVRNEDWANNWKQYYHARRISPHLAICPSWEDYSPEEGERVIRLDPGAAFGTGEHATTSLCLRCLDELHRTGQLPERILDLGAGSAILAIAAGLLQGASEGTGAEDAQDSGPRKKPAILALDIDPSAVAVAQANVEQNGLARQICCRQGTLQDLLAELESGELEAFPLILANILAEVHLDLLPLYRRCLQPGGLLLLSGIINTKLPAVEEAYKVQGFRCLRQEEEKDWVMLLLQPEAQA